MLTLKALRQDSFIETAGDQIVIGRTFTRQYRPLDIDKGKDNGMSHALIFGLDVVNSTVVLNVRVVAGNQGYQVRAPSSLSHDQISCAYSKVSITIFGRSNTCRFRLRVNQHRLDTPWSLQYDQLVQ